MMFSGLCPPSTDIRGSHRLGGEAFEYAHPPARSSRTWLSLRRRMSQLWRGPISSYLLVSAHCSGFLVFSACLFQPFPLRDGSFYYGTAPWYFLSRCTWPQTSSNELNNRVRLPAARVAARVVVRRWFQHDLKRELMLQPSDMPEMLIPLTSNRLVVFCHDLMTYSYKPAGESLVLQTWLMSEPFAPDPLDERIVSLPAEIQGERLHVISLMTRLPGNSFGPLALLNVYAGGTDTVTRVPVERFDIDLYYMADKHEALGMGLSYTCHGAFCTENEVYHFDNVFFKIGEDEARLMSPSQPVLLETGYEALQRAGLIRASVGLAFQAEHSSFPSSTCQPFDEYICHLWHHYS